jgi:hypothetical protein
MTSLLDIAPSIETVEINGKKVAVDGVSAEGIAILLRRFPELRQLLSGRTVEAERLMAMGGEAVAAIIAAGTGFPGNEEAERIAGRLPAGPQIELIEAVLRLTMPGGIGPFVAALGRMGALLGVASPPPAPSSPKPSKR